MGGNNSSNVSAKDSTINIQAIDQGAVNSAFGFARHVSDNAVNLASASMLNSTQAQQTASQQVADAYSTAKAGEQKIFAGAALAIVAFVAVILFKGRAI